MICKYAGTTVVCGTTGVFEFVDSTPRPQDAGARLLVSLKSVEVAVLQVLTLQPEVLLSQLSFCDFLGFEIHYA